MAYEQVELASVPFLTFVANKDGKAKPQLLLRAARLCQTLARQCLGDRVKLLDLFGAAETTPARAQAGGRS